ILEPVQNCILALCTQNCTLEDAHCAIEVCLDLISNVKASIASDLKDNIILKVSERMSPLFNVSIFLENRQMFDHPKYFKFPSRAQILREMTALLQDCDLYQEPDIEPSPENE